MDTLRKNAELPFAEQALRELESQYGIAKAADDAARATRVELQAKQRELQAVATDVQKDLVKLRTVVRIVLGVRHFDYQYLRLRSARAAGESAEAEDEGSPETADRSPAGDRASEPSETG